jgi:MFS family permease
MSTASPQSVNPAAATTSPPNARTLPYAGPNTPPPASDWSPLRNPIFRAMWIASAISYTGFEIRNYAAPLLMVDYQKVYHISAGMGPYTVTASTLPIPLLVLFAGALADIIDRRKLLIVTHIVMMLVAGLLGVLTISHRMPPGLMLAFLFAIGAGYAMMNPTLLAVLPELVSPSEIRSALALNGLNMNIARVMGPLVGGLIVLICGEAHFYAGKGLAFLATGASLAGVIWVVYHWKPPQRQRPAHPETVLGAIGTGFRYTWFSPLLLSILARIFIFIVCAGIAPTIAGIICKKNPATLHGDLGAMIWMISFGLGAILGVYQMQKLQRRFGIEEIVTVCTIGFGLAAIGVAHTPNLWLGCLCMALAGFSWVIVPTNFNISTQLAVPAWIKGRAMGMYVLVLWGAFAVGSAFFGRIMTALADPAHPDFGPRRTLSYAGIGVLVGSIAILWLRLQPRTKEDLSPLKAAAPPRPEALFDLAAPVRVLVDYHVPTARREEFRHRMRELRAQRLRNGATHWNLAEDNGTLRETFEFSSWAARVRHHDRTTQQDAQLLESLRAFHEGDQPPAERYQRIPEGERAAKSSSPNATPVTRGRLRDAFDREFIRFCDRLVHARLRDPNRFRPRPPVHVGRVPPDGADC